MCRRESRVIRHRNYVRSVRFTLAAVRANIFLLPLLWAVVVATGQTLRAEALFLCMVGFRVLRDFVSFKLLSVIVSCAEMKVSFSRMKVRQGDVLRRSMWQARCHLGYCFSCVGFFSSLLGIALSLSLKVRSPLHLALSQ